jgi:UDP-N-acetylmuramyl pentapeptide phosphotransferase/UDP-N-acetylglucosamine-1-phosphate transferase
MLSILLQISLVLVALVVLGTVLKLIVLPFALVAGVIGFLAHNWLPIALVGGAIWWVNRQNRRRLPGG